MDITNFYAFIDKTIYNHIITSIITLASLSGYKILVVKSLVHPETLHEYSKWRLLLLDEYKNPYYEIAFAFTNARGIFFYKIKKQYALKISGPDISNFMTGLKNIEDQL